jgi:hypothetical protein
MDDDDMRSGNESSIIRLHEVSFSDTRFIANIYFVCHIDPASDLLSRIVFATTSWQWMDAGHGNAVTVARLGDDTREATSMRAREWRASESFCVAGRTIEEVMHAAGRHRQRARLWTREEV